MNSKITISFLIAILFAFFVNDALSIDCGYIYDGPRLGVDIDRQNSNTTIQAVWEGFGEGVKYEVAIISEDMATRTVKKSGNEAPNSTRCRDTESFNGTNPDVKGYTSVKGTYFIDDNLDLVKGVRYYVVLRVSDGDEVLYTNSNGVTIGFPDDDDDDDDEFAGWKIGLITAACVLCCLLILLLLLLLLLKGKGEDKYTTTVHRNDNVEKL